MIKDKSIFIKNIYYMLSYAFTTLTQDGYEDVATEEFENIHNLFAAILAKGIGRQLKQGLYREYLNRKEDIPVVRGKIDMQGTIQNRMARKRVVTCEYDELSENNLLNQILKTTVMLLLRHAKVSQAHKSDLKKEMLFFSNVDTIAPTSIRWSSIRFQRNNNTYRMLISICQLILEGMLLTTDSGEYKLASFVDAQRMERLYEKFILEVILIFNKSIRIKSRFHFEEAETAAQSIINHRKTSVGRIHHADDVKILRHREGKSIVRQRCLRPSVVPFNQHQQLTENLTHIATIDLINDEEEILIRLIGCLLAELIKDAIFQLKAILHRLVSHHKILIGIILMELHKLNTVVILFAHHRPRQSSGSKGFSNTRSALQDDVLFILKYRHKVLVAFLRHKYFSKEIILCIFLYGFFHRYRICFAHDIQNKIIFLFGQPKQTALCILEIFHLLQFRARLQYRK